MFLTVSALSPIQTNGEVGGWERHRLIDVDETLHSLPSNHTDVASNQFNENLAAMENFILRTTLNLSH